MTDADPVFEASLQTEFTVKANKGLVVVKNSGSNKIFDLKLDGTSIFIKAGISTPVISMIKHTLQMENATLSLVHELLRDHNADLRFTSTYFYIHRRPNLQNYMAIGPVTTEFGGKTKDIRHILPGRFLCTKGPAPISYFFNTSDPTTPLLNKDIKIKDPTTAGKLNKVLMAPETQNALSNLVKSAHVSVSNELKKFEVLDGGNYRFVFHMTTKFYRYYWGEFVRVLPMPEFPKPGARPHHGLLLGIGDSWWTETPTGLPTNWWNQRNLWDSIYELNPILLAGGKQTVLIRGQPGSGKEVFSNTLHHGAVRKRAGDAGLKARAIANMGKDDLAELLYGRIVDGAKIPGLISEADGGTLFLDEFDKVEDPGWYSELLRVLEAGEYVPRNGSLVEKVLDVNWIFAGAFTGTGSSKNVTVVPPDFWSRLTAQIKIVNPISLAPRTYNKISMSYAGAVFSYFILREAADLAQGVASLLSGDKFPADYANRLVMDLPDPISKNFMERVCLEFQKKITLGAYWRVDQVHPERIPALYWVERTSEYLPTPTPTGYEAVPEFDSVRSIIKAAQAAFITMKHEAMTHRNFWRTANPPDVVYTKAVDRAAKIVKEARPGKPIKIDANGVWRVQED